LVAVTLAAPLGAQAPVCRLETGKPFQLNSARIYLNKALGGTKDDEKPAHLRNAINVLTTDAGKINNAAGRQWLLGKVLILWSERAGISPVVTRSQVGYTENPSGTIDLLAAADSAFDAVESLAPQCADSVGIYRRRPYAKFYNAAIERFNAKAYDSSLVLLRRATVLIETPGAYNLMSNIAMARGDTAGYEAALKRSVATTETDSVTVKIRRQAMLNLAITSQSRAQGQQGAARTALMQQAIGYYQMYLKEVPGDATAQSNLAAALNASGQSASAVGIYDEMLANPGRFSSLQLLEAGSVSASAKRTQDAMRLLEAGLKGNPNHRDGLFNLANLYFAANDADRLAPVVRKLVELDPNSYDNWRLYAGQYQIRQKKGATAREKKASTDSLIRYVERSNNIKVKVSDLQLTHSGTRHTLSGMVKNEGAASITPDLTVEFLDAGGAVVATQKVVVGTVPAKGATRFTTTADRAGIAAYRYKEIR